MSKEIAGLPGSIKGLLNGRDLDDKVGETFLVITVSDDGWPHVAMLSVGEVVVAPNEEIRLALWAGTSTGANLARSGKGLLALTSDGAGYYLEITARAEGPLTVADARLEAFSCSVNRVLADEVGYATLTSGIRFDLPDRVAVVDRWQATIKALLDA